MRIIQVVKTSVGAKWAFDQAIWLNNNGVEIITVLPDLNGGIAKKYIENGMQVIVGDFSLPLKSPLKLFGQISKIRKMIEQFEPDLIHFHFVTNIILCRIALKNNNVPRIFQVPGPLHLEKKFFRNMELFFSNDYDYWIGGCKKTCSMYLEAGVNPQKIFLGYYGGYGGRACDMYSNRSFKLRNEYRIKDDNLLVGMVSYFYKPKKYLFQSRGIKGHEDFIDAIKIVRQSNPKIVGIIIGDSWGKSDKYVIKVKKYANEKCPNGIIFTGFRNDVKDIYKDLDIVVHPSHSENLGGAAESLAAGVPTISTNVGGFPDIVIDNFTGLTVPPKSPIQLANAIVKLTSSKDKSKSMSLEGRRLVKDLLDVNNTGAEIKKIYREILER